MRTIEEIPVVENDLSRRDFLFGSAAVLLLGGCGGGGGEPAADTRVVEHKFGRTELPPDPDRVVTVGFNEADFALALGVVPVGVRDFIGPFREEERPWAREELGGARPKLVGGEEINYEAVAALEPDLILGVYSFVDRDGYELLSEIAPTVAQPARYPDGGTPWQEQTLITGRALGREERAREVVAGVERRFERARSEHPEFAGKVMPVVFATEGQFYVLGPDDLRTRLFTALGFEMPERTGPISRERVDLLDRDVVVFIGTDRKTLENDELLRSLDAVREGRVVYFGDFATDFAGALGYSSPLSLPFALEIAVPRLAAAVAR
ncbi:iron-siderophore ABC transporter substrate-binding protein [Rubrobacter xylanophilus]|nr:iron-siderophore ABC transporter substrate-binding protein [Rubrobacter xylanophilus]